MPETKKALVVGGADSLVRGNFGKKLAEYGVEVDTHYNAYDGGGNLTGVPATCDVVIIIKDNAINHAMSDKAKDLAKLAGVPFAIVQRKWSLAEPLLRMYDIIEDETPQPERAVAVEMIEGQILEYLCDQRATGHHPTYEETETAIHKAHPGHELTRKSYEVLTMMAVSKVPEKKSAPPSKKQIEEWAMAAVEELPDRLLAIQHKELTSSVAGLLGVQDDEKETKRCVKIVQAWVKGLRRGWATHQQMDQDADQWRTKVMATWIRHWVRNWFEDKRPDAPSYKNVMAQSKDLFGKCLVWDVVKNARATVIGEWARELEGIPAVQIKADEQWPRAKLNIRELATTGAIPSIQVSKYPSRFFTSVFAVQEYMEAQMDAAVEAIEETVPLFDPNPTPPPVVSECPDTPAVDIDALERILARNIAPLVQQIGVLKEKVESLEKALRDQDGEIKTVLDGDTEIEVIIRARGPLKR